MYFSKVSFLPLFPPFVFISHLVPSPLFIVFPSFSNNRLRLPPYSPTRIAKAAVFSKKCPLFFKEYSLLPSCLSFILDVARHNKKNGKQTAQQANTIYAGSNDRFGLTSEYNLFFHQGFYTRARTRTLWCMLFCCHICHTSCTTLSISAQTATLAHILTKEHFIKKKSAILVRLLRTFTVFLD